jgi:hypothetical protein
MSATYHPSGESLIHSIAPTSLLENKRFIAAEPDAEILKAKNWTKLDQIRPSFDGYQNNDPSNLLNCKEIGSSGSTRTYNPSTECQ